MAGEIANNGVQTRTYAQAQMGYRNLSGNGVNATTIGLGTQAQYKGFHAGAEVNVGTVLNGKLEVGKEFNLGKNWSLDVSERAEGTLSMGKSNRSVVMYDAIQNQEIEVNGQNISISNNTTAVAKDSQKPGEIRVGTSFMATHTGKNIKYGVGLEAGTSWNNTSRMKLEGNTESYAKATINGKPVDVECHVSGAPSTIGSGKTVASAYVTPKAFVEATPFKNKNVSLFGQADARQGSAGVRFTF